jgi:four helix bundle protein
MPQHDAEQQRAWEQTCSEAITSDVLWKLDAYRAALFLLHTTRLDCQALRAVRAVESLTSQLLRAAGSVSATLCEGYSRSTRADRLRYMGYALGSARECFPWYETLRGELPDDTVNERLRLLARVRSLLLGLIRSLRRDTKGGGELEP